jgi:hypothetical protein
MASTLRSVPLTARTRPAALVDHLWHTSPPLTVVGTRCEGFITQISLGSVSRFFGGAGLRERGLEWRGVDGSSHAPGGGDWLVAQNFEGSGRLRSLPTRSGRCVETPGRLAYASCLAAASNEGTISQSLR